MRTAISATGANLDDTVDPRFGRCQYFVMVDSDTMEFEGVENANMMAGGGAGIATAQMIANEGAQVVLTGNCGPNAYETLSAAGIQVITGVSGTVLEVVEGFKSGKYKATDEANVETHFGMRGGGGGGCGRRTSRPQTIDTEQELHRLRDLTQTLTDQVESLQRRIDEIEKQK
jgi:predicted Fe-Mo cluster-binding NifX family protein